MYENILFVLAFVLIIPGVFMALVPMLPALSYMFIVALLFAIINSFTALTGGELSILLAITLASIVIDHLSGIMGAKFGGAHTKSLLWGFIGGFLGTLVLPVIGSFAGLFLGVLASEFYYRKSGQNAREEAMKAASGALIGSITGVVVNVVLAILFSALFFFFASS